MFFVYCSDRFVVCLTELCCQILGRAMLASVLDSKYGRSSIGSNSAIKYSRGSGSFDSIRITGILLQLWRSGLILMF